MSRAGGWWLNKVSLDAVRDTDLQPLEDAVEEAGRPVAADVLRAYVLFVLPAAKPRMGVRRQAQAGFVRFCATAWVCSRRAVRARTLEEFAGAVGVQKAALAKQVGLLRRVLAGEHPAQMRLPPPAYDAGPFRPIPHTGSAKASDSIVSHAAESD